MTANATDYRTREMARRIGQNKFYTGKPCKRGHFDFRYVATGACCSCIKVYNQSAILNRVSLRVQVHPDDVSLVQNYVAALRLDRELKEYS